MAKPLVLVVEDNPISMRLMSVMLTVEKCPFVSATNVAEARAQLAKAVPTLVFMDIQIPGGSGELVLDEMRQNAALSHVRVIALTASTMEGNRERLLNAGFDGYFSKPVDTVKIREIIRQHIEEVARGAP